MTSTTLDTGSSVIIFPEKERDKATQNKLDDRVNSMERISLVAVSCFVSITLGFVCRVIPDACARTFQNTLYCL
jgi:hypothetical protein